MNITASCKEFYREVLPLKQTAFCALGGFLSGRFLGTISPVHGAVYVVAARITYLVINKVMGDSYCQSYKLSNWMGQIVGKVTFGKFSYNVYENASFISNSLNIANIYLCYGAGNQILSLLGGQVVFATALKVSCVSGVITYFSAFLFDNGTSILRYIKNSKF